MTLQFNIPLILGNEIDNVKEAINSKKLSGEGTFNKKCSKWFEKNICCKKALPVPSCTMAMEMGLMLIDLNTWGRSHSSFFHFSFYSNSCCFAWRNPRFHRLRSAYIQHR